MTKPLQGKKFFEFRNRIMGIPNGENIAEVRRMRDEIAQNEDLQNGWTDRGLESKTFKQEINGFVSARPKPEGVCWKIENNVSWFDVLRDDDDVIEWHTWQDNVTQTSVSIIINHRTIITNPRTKYRREYHIKLKWSPLIKYEPKGYPRELGVILTHPSRPFVHTNKVEWVRVYLQQSQYRTKLQGEVIVVILKGNSSIIDIIDVLVENNLVTKASKYRDVQVWGMRDICPVYVHRGHTGYSNMDSGSVKNPYHLEMTAQYDMARVSNVREVEMKRYTKSLLKLPFVVIKCGTATKIGSLSNRYLWGKK